MKYTVKEVSENTASHLSQLDLLRGAAILGVLLFHCFGFVFGKDQPDFQGLWRTFETEPRSSFYLFLPLTLGSYGVALFFVISGFVIHYSTLRQPLFLANKFFLRRFWRIYPPYILALFLFTTWEWSKHGGAPHLWLMQEFWLHATFLHNIRQQDFFQINSSFWSLATEVQFYLMYPLLLWLVGRFGLWNTLKGLLIFRIVAALALLPFQNWKLPIHGSLFFSAPILWFDWALGAWLAERYFAGIRVFNRPNVWLSVAAIALLLAFQNKMSYVFTFILSSIFFAVLIEQALYAKIKETSLTRSLSTLGVCSYSFYLFHQPLLIIGLRRIQALGIKSEIPQMFALVGFGLTVIFGISWLLYISAEKWSHAMGKRLTATK